MEAEVQREVLRDRGLLQTPVMRSKWRGSDLIIGVKPAAPSPGLGPIELPDAVDGQSKDGTSNSGKFGTGKTGGGQGKTPAHSSYGRRHKGASRK